MSTATATAVVPPSTCPLLVVRRFLPSKSAAACLLTPTRYCTRFHTACQVAVSSDTSPSSDVDVEAAAAAPKLGKRVRVTSPVRVHHVSKAPDLDLRGMEGVVRQYVSVWKGKRITANLPFKVEFELKLDGQVKSVRFFVHLRDDEFEFVEDK